jgi:2OG-Fe(II) oxygenase superfamily
VTTADRAQRPIVGHPIPLQIDFMDIGLIENEDLIKINEVADQFGREVALEGPAPESTLEQHEVPLTYKVTDGTVIVRQLPKLAALYQSQIPAFIRDYIGLEIIPSRFERSAMTLNLLEGRGKRYETHLDSNSVTGLLYVTTLSSAEGGALRLHYPDREPLDIQPRAGVFLLYDARWVPHEVLELQTDCRRLSIPMNYFLPSDIETRPAHLDSYIFGE